MNGSSINSITIPLWQRISNLLKNKFIHLNSRRIKVGIWAESYSNSRMEFKVFIEERGSVPVSDLKVSVFFPDGRFVYLTYDCLKEIYSCSTISPAVGEYRMIIEAPGITPVVVRFHHQPLTGVPVIIFMIDESGTGTLDGNDPDSRERILIAWEPVSEATGYEGQILKGGDTIYRFCTGSTIFSLDRKLLSGSSEFTLVLRARQITGDPVLIYRDFYSGSFSEACEFSFRTI